MPNELHHRSHEILQAYWESLKNGRPFPAEQDVDPDAIKDIWKSCYLIAIDEVTSRNGYRYSYLGDDLIEAYGDDVRNPEVAPRLISTASMPLVSKFNEVVEQKRPVVDESEFVNLKRIKIRYRTCLLPLGQSGKVTHILGCMRWKIY